MGDPPEFLTYPVFSSNEETFRPLRPTRRGELIAWLTAVGLGLSLGLIDILRGGVPCYALGLEAFLLSAAALISFSNWLETRTSIQVCRRGLRYQSPLRKISISWADVDCLAALKTRMGWRIMVEGVDGRFAFRTGGRIEIGSLAAAMTGFPDGERLASLIRGMAGLSAPNWQEGIWLSGRGNS